MTAGSSRRTTSKVVAVGTVNVSLAAGQTRTVRVALNRTGKRLFRSRHGLKARLRITQATASGERRDGLQPGRHVQGSQEEGGGHRTH